jgi:hypothetical protein
MSHCVSYLILCSAVTFVMFFYHFCVLYVVFVSVLMLCVSIVLKS